MDWLINFILKMPWYIWILVFVIWFLCGFLIFLSVSVVDKLFLGDYMLSKRNSNPKFYDYWFPILIILSGLGAILIFGWIFGKHIKENIDVDSEILKQDNLKTAQKNSQIIIERNNNIEKV